MAETKTTKAPVAKKATKKAPAKKAAAKATPKKATTPKTGFYVIETGGKQYKVSSGDTVKIEKLADAKKVGDKVIFDKVLLIDDGKETRVGDPYLKGEKLEATLEAEGRDKKVLVIHFKNKIRYNKKYGHRQPFQKVAIK